MNSSKIRKANGTPALNGTPSTSTHQKHSNEAYEEPVHQSQNKLAEPKYHDLLVADDREGDNTYETLPDQARGSRHEYGNFVDTTDES